MTLEPKITDFYNELDPRGISSSEYNDYLKAVKEWESKSRHRTKTEDEVLKKTLLRVGKNKR